MRRKLLLFLVLLAVAPIGVQRLVAQTDADQAADKPTLFLIGDSTVKNGRGDGAGGLWGWGQVLQEHFNSDRIRVENRALGGRSSRTYLTEGLWERTLERMKPGDYVLIQFGHNDGGQLFEGDRPRASIKGNSDETVEGVVEMTGERETVHSYGWYLRKYIQDAKEKGATPIVLSLVPRNIWRDGRVVRASGDYGAWAKQAAEQGGAAFIDLNEIVAKRYEADGEDKVAGEYFTDVDHTHTTKAGAQVNAASVVEGIRRLEDVDLKQHLKPSEPERDAAGWRLDFGDGELGAEATRVTPGDAYSAEKGYGFEPGATLATVPAPGDGPLLADACVSEAPFYFSVKVPEGNYRVTTTFAVADGETPSAVKAELRRLMTLAPAASDERWVTRTFNVNVRTPALPDGRRVRLKGREKTTEAWAWDGKLTLEFNGPRPGVSRLEITPVDDVVTVYLAGDSTVADQPLEPWNSWGQMLPLFFEASVAVANHSESGESVRSSLGARRFDKIFSLVKPGDFLFMQFGHNDMKSDAPDALATYKSNLNDLVARARDKGVTPVLVTSMERKAGVERDTLGDYPQTVRDVAQEEDVALIDLHAMSKTLYAALGDDLDRAFQDGTHHNNYGSFQLARCVVEGIRESVPELAAHLSEHATPYDPAKPDAPSQWRLPESPARSPLTPEGS